MTDRQSVFLIQKNLVEKTFTNWVVASIKAPFEDTSKDGKGTPLAAYILLSCAIDAIAGFFAGRVGTRGSSTHYKDFLVRYMPQYGHNVMYRDLRCALAHNYSLGPGLALTHANPSIHNAPTGDGGTIQNFEELLRDFEGALERYFLDLETDIDLQKSWVRD